LVALHDHGAIAENDVVLTNHNAYVGRWAPKVGPAAAELRWKSNLRVLSAYLSNFIWIPLVLAGLQAHEWVITAAGATFGVGGFMLVLDSASKLRRANRLTSLTLGFKVGFLAVGPPPRTTRSYQAWCRKHGAVPYGANDPARASRHAPGPDGSKTAGAS
jgi:hypothetical protein